MATPRDLYQSILGSLSALEPHLDTPAIATEVKQVMTEVDDALDSLVAWAENPED
jgi:hypothetical protein